MEHGFKADVSGVSVKAAKEERKMDAQERKRLHDSTENTCS